MTTYSQYEFQGRVYFSLNDKQITNVQSEVRGTANLINDSTMNKYKVKLADTSYEGISVIDH